MNDIKNKASHLLFQCIFIFFFMALVSCTSVINKNEEWEGIQNNTLRVFVKLDIPDTTDRKNFEKAMTENLMNAGMNRAGLLLMSYLRIYQSDFEHIETGKQKIQELIVNGKIRHQKCFEDYCLAFVDFNVKNFLDSAGRHEAR